MLNDAHVLRLASMSCDVYLQPCDERSRPPKQLGLFLLIFVLQGEGTVYVQNAAESFSRAVSQLKLARPCPCKHSPCPSSRLHPPGEGGDSRVLGLVTGFGFWASSQFGASNSSVPLTPRGL